MTYLPKNTRLGLIVLIVLGIAYVFTTNRGDEFAGGSEQLTLATGATKRIVDGRAQIWIGEIDTDHATAGGLEPAVEFELTCGGKTFSGWAVMSTISKEMCGFRVRLLEQLETSPPSARIEVSWMDKLSLNHQSAAQASAADERPFPKVQRSRAAP